MERLEKVLGARAGQWSDLEDGSAARLIVHPSSGSGDLENKLWKSRGDNPLASLTRAERKAPVVVSPG